MEKRCTERTVEVGRTEPVIPTEAAGAVVGKKNSGDERAALVLYWMVTNWIARLGHSMKLVGFIAIFGSMQIFGCRRALELRPRID